MLLGLLIFCNFILVSLYRIGWTDVKLCQPPFYLYKKTLLQNLYDIRLTMLLTNPCDAI